jgi:hypothetical protein
MVSQCRRDVPAVYEHAGISNLGVPFFYTLLAEVSVHLGRTDDGLQALTAAYTLMEQQEDRWWEAEVHRLRGVLLLR